MDTVMMDGHDTELFVMIDSLIAMNKARRTLHVNSQKALGLPRWASEHCTLRLDMGWHTAQMLYMISRATEKDLIIVSTPQDIARYRNHGYTHGIISGRVTEEECRGRTPQIIYIEHPSMVTTVMDNSVHYIFTYTGHETFVLLGK